MEILLTNQRAFPWYQSGHVWAKGYLYDAENKLFQEKGITAYFQEITNENEMVQKLREANGSFLVILQIGEVFYVAVDRLRSMLLFVAQKDGKICIGDDASMMRDKLGLGKDDLDPLKVEELRQSGYTVGSHTIYRAIAQLRGGEYAVVTNTGHRIKCYYEHTHGDFFNVSREEAFQMLDGVTERMFRRLIDSVHGRQIVVPLSGGYDSRYVVAGLKKFGYEHVCCFTYGRKDSYEVHASRQVAEKLGYEWHFVEYTLDTWASIFTEEWMPFYIYSGQLSQIPHIQDIYAIRYLLEQGVIQKDAIVVPGYCGDGLGGSYVMPTAKIKEYTPQFLAQWIADVHFRFLFDNPMHSEIVEDIRASFSSQDVSTFSLYNSVHEAWFTINRWSKFVVNALRGYDYFGLEWRIPLWDNELMEFWYRVSYAHRGHPTWYDEYLMEGLFKEEGVAFHKRNIMNGNPTAFVFLRLMKRGLKHVLSKSILDKMQKRLFPQFDFNQYSGLWEALHNRIPVDVKDCIRNRESPNPIVALWYLHEVAKIF